MLFQKRYTIQKIFKIKSAKVFMNTSHKYKGKGKVAPVPTMKAHRRRNRAPLILGLSTRWT